MSLRTDSEEKKINCLIAGMKDELMINLKD